MGDVFGLLSRPRRTCHVTIPRPVDRPVRLCRPWPGVAQHRLRRDRSGGRADRRPRHQTRFTDGQSRQSDHRRRPAQSRPEGHQELGHAAGRAHLGHVGRHRHRPEGRPHLGLRALRRRRGRRGGRRPGRLRQQPGRSGLQVRPQHRRGARQHRQGRHGDAARHRRSTRRATSGSPTSPATRPAPRATRSTSSAPRARS